MTSKILATSLTAFLAGVASLLSGCTDTPSAPASTAGTRVATASALRIHGDLFPSQLVPLAIPKPTETALLSGSDALAPRKPFVAQEAPSPVVGHEMRRVMQGSDPNAFTFPVDAPQGARVIVRSVAGIPITTVHLVSVATGAVLDLARDSSNTVVAQHGTGAPSPDVAALRSLKDGPGASTTPVAPAGAPLREPGFAPMLASRMVAFDLPTTPGLVRLQVSPEVAAGGVIMELQQPQTHIALSGVPAELNYGYGDTAELTFQLASDGAAIDGATLTGYVELKDHGAGPDLVIVPQGGGVYKATLPLGDTDWQHMGVWGIHAKAKGTFQGVAFERDVETAFGYYVAHAHMTALGTPRTVRGSDGLVDEVTVDVDVESLADDRFSVRATLTTADPDGTEHPIATAQTGQTMSAGSSTLTLHFSASSMALAKIDGPFHVRDVALVSQAYGFTEHRIGLGLNLATEPFKAREIRYPAVLSIQAQDLVDNGDLPAP